MNRGFWNSLKKGFKRFFKSKYNPWLDGRNTKDN